MHEKIHCCLKICSQPIRQILLIQQIGKFRIEWLHEWLMTYCSIPPGVTILLSLTVFLLQLAETMPPTSDAVSIIGANYRNPIKTKYKNTQFSLARCYDRIGVVYGTLARCCTWTLFTHLEAFVVSFPVMAWIIMDWRDIYIFKSIMFTCCIFFWLIVICIA